MKTIILSLVTIGALAGCLESKEPTRNGSHYGAAAASGNEESGCDANGCERAMVPLRPDGAGQTGMEVRKVTVRDLTHSMNVVLDESTVLCSAADYSATFLKVLIPQIADVTLFDHRNAGVDAPCIAAGACTDALSPATILDSCHPNEQIDVNVALISEYHIDHDQKTCAVSLVERINTEIRGIRFFHTRGGDISSRTYQDCLGIVATAP